MSEQGTMATDALATLGTIIGADARRDAIHLAVDPAIAGEQLAPGQRVVVYGGVARRATWPEVIAGREIGIVDPFLSMTVEPGERFWLVVLPRTIRSLRHVWTHPGLPDEPMAGIAVKDASGGDRAHSEGWLRDFCARSDCPDYEYVMSAIADSIDFLDEGSLSLGRDASGEIPAEFLDHVEVVLGRSVSGRPTYFSCSC